MDSQTAPNPKPDNLLGICHALGETFGFNPIFLRLALIVGVMLNAEATLAIYAIGGVAVLTAKLFTSDIVSRLFARTRRSARIPA